MLPRLGIALRMAMGSVSAALAETPYEPGNYEFLERQYVFASPQQISVNGEKDHLAFEAQVGPHVPLLGRGWGPDPRLDWSDELRLLFTFQTYLRMTFANSAPVVTPSYLPQLRVQWLRRRTDVDAALNPLTDWRWGFTLDVFSHHSNGQDGCTLLPLPAPGDDCATRQGATGINERNGSFGTNHLGLNLHFRRSPFRAFHGPTSSLLGTLGVQFHHDVPGGGLQEELVPLWGRWHAHAELEGRYHHPSQPALGYGYARYRIDAMSGGQDPLLPEVGAGNWRHTGEFGVILAKAHGLGLFVRLVTGREYYNIEFTQEVTRFQGGITIDTFGEPARFDNLTQDEERQLRGQPRTPPPPPPEDESSD
jgi:hypothetical protein